MHEFHVLHLKTLINIYNRCIYKPVSSGSSVSSLSTRLCWSSCATAAFCVRSIETGASVPGLLQTATTNLIHACTVGKSVFSGTSNLRDTVRRGTSSSATIPAVTGTRRSESWNCKRRLQYQYISTLRSWFCLTWRCVGWSRCAGWWGWRLAGAAEEGLLWHTHYCPSTMQTSPPGKTC